MTKISIIGGIPLEGEVTVSGYKNSAGALLAGVLLSEEPSIIDNIPLVSDILNQIKVIEAMGGKVEWLEKRKIKINPANIDPAKIPAELFEKMRISVLLMGSLLARFKKVRVPSPGGDKIGLRPITTHIEAFKRFGIKVVREDGIYLLEAPEKIHGKRIALKEFSVTATENIMMLAALAQGKTTIEIAAAEPQVQDLGELLRKMGAKVSGLGTHTITIVGKEKLSGAEHTVCPDPLEAGTFMIALAATGGSGIIKGADPRHLTFFLEKMRDIGVRFSVQKNDIHVFKSTKFKPIRLQALPYPGFPTDLQPQISILLTQAQGKSLIHEPLYENRFNHLHELRKMGADIEITDPHRALVFGKTKLIANRIKAPDIRSGATLIIAGLIAEGTTQIDDISQIERGYENIDEKFKKLGAKIERI